MSAPDSSRTEFGEYVGAAILIAGLAAVCLLIALAPTETLAGLALAILTYLAY